MSINFNYRRYKIKQPENKIHDSESNTDKPSYWNILQDDRWIKIRSIILERDAQSCVNCRSTKNLHIHHRQYRLDKNTGEFISPWNYPMHLLITLCKDCHESGHKKFQIPIIKI